MSGKRKSVPQQPTFTVNRGTMMKKVLETTNDVENKKGWEPRKMSDMRSFGPFGMLRLLTVEDEQVRFALKNAGSNRVEASNGINERGRQLAEAMSSSDLISEVPHGDFPTNFDWSYTSDLIEMDTDQFFQTKQLAAWSSVSTKVHV
jgi:hypothetical protein